MIPKKKKKKIGKQDLHSVSLVWQSDSMNEPTQSENVLEGLQPNSNLKKLCISCYRGTKFKSEKAVHKLLSWFKIFNMDEGFPSS